MTGHKQHKTKKRWYSMSDETFEVLAAASIFGVVGALVLIAALLA